MMLSRKARRRFSLLLLSEAEHFFKDYACTVHSSNTGTSSGRVHLCSESILFEPDRSSDPLLRLRFEHVYSFKLVPFPAPASDPNVHLLKEAEAGFSSSGLLGLKQVLFLQTSELTAMKIDGRNHQYIPIVGDASFIVALPYSNVSLEFESFNSLMSLGRILDPNTRAERLQAIVAHEENAFSFDTSWFVNHKEKMVHNEPVLVDIIEPLVRIPALLVITESRVYLQLMHNVDASPMRRFEVANLTQAYPRKYKQRSVAIELFFDHSKVSTFVAFRDSLVRDRMMSCIGSLDAATLSREQPLRELQALWRRKKLSNFDYIMALNREAGRSMANFSAYPVFPWVISDYESTELDLCSKSTFRDLSKPIGAQNPQRLASFQSRFNEMPDPKFHYGTHYSTPGYVVFFRVRSDPQYMLRLQNGQFDAPDRLFYSVRECWESCQNNSADVKELIPEFYSGDGSFLINQQALELGSRQNGDVVDDVVLPPWAQNAADFVAKSREALESDYVSEHLPAWIDLIFGCKQTGDAAIRANNVFYYLSYEGAVDLEAIVDPIERAAMERQIDEFGCTPTKLFSNAHPARTASSDESDHHHEKLPINEDDQSSAAIAVPEACWEASLSTKMRLISEPITLHQSGSITSIAISKDDEDRILSVAKDSSLRLYSLSKQRVLRSCTLGSLSLSSCGWINQDLAAIGSWDNHIYLYSLASGRSIACIRAHDDAVSCLALATNGSALVSGSWDSIVKVWDLDERGLGKSPIREFMEHDTEVRCIAAKGDIAVSGSDDGTVIIWDLRQEHSVHLLDRVHDDEVSGVCISPDGHRIITCSIDGSCCVLDTSSGSEVARFADQYSAISCVITDGYQVAYGDDDGIVSLWDLSTTKSIGHLEDTASERLPIRCLDAGSMVFASGSEGDKGGVLKVWSRSNR